MRRIGSLFERWDLDPAQSPAELTRAMQQLARSLPPEQRQELRDDWRALTTDAAAHLAQALWTHPRVTSLRDPWAQIEALPDAPTPTLPELQATLEDALHLDARTAPPGDLRPPFWPSVRDTGEGDPT